MLIGLVYFIVIIIANTVGAISGMGGGIIIKPVLDAINYHSVVEISFFSSVAVFSMVITSTVKQLANGVNVRLKLALTISVGSIIGGLLGNALFEQLILFFPDGYVVQLVQIVLTILSLIFVLMFTKEEMKTYTWKKQYGYFLIGVFLGGLATLLGIGGGPINVTLLMIVFSFPIKEATTYSIITIFFSQLSRLVAIGFSKGYIAFDLSMLYWIIPAALFGGFLGGKLSNTLSDSVVMKIFKRVVITVIFLNVWNGMINLSLI